jgi:flagellin-like protein
MFKFNKNDEAVSPVIGVILMVAITVVLAAVVFMLVMNLSKNNTNSSPTISFSQSKNNLTVISATSGVVWYDLEVNGCLNVPIGEVKAGNVISGCGKNVTIRYIPSNSLIYQG